MEAKQKSDIKDEIAKLYANTSKMKISFKSNSKYLIISSCIIFQLVISLTTGIGNYVLEKLLCAVILCVCLFIFLLNTEAKKYCYIVSADERKFIIETCAFFENFKIKKEILFYELNNNYYYDYSEKQLSQKQIIEDCNVHFFYHYMLHGNENKFKKVVCKKFTNYSYDFRACIIQKHGEGIDFPANYKCRIKCRSNEISSIKSYINVVYKQIETPIVLPLDFKNQLKHEGVELPECSSIVYQ